MEPRPRFKACEDTGSGTSKAERESIGTLRVRSGVTRGVASLGDIPGHHSLWIRAGYRPLLSRSPDHTDQYPTVSRPATATVGHPRRRQCWGTEALLWSKVSAETRHEGRSKLQQESEPCLCTFLCSPQSPDAMLTAPKNSLPPRRWDIWRLLL